ncbi:hypothetical protein GCM10028807_35470 [Spirosoma daeguense]
MQALDKETFSYWVTHPEDLSVADLNQLQENLSAFPYCQSLYTLTAKAASIHQRTQAVSSVRQAAAHALSRNALRKLVDNEFQWSTNLLTRLNELSAKHVPIPDDYQQESYALFKSKSGLSGGFPKLQLLRLPTMPTPEDTTLTETTLQNDLAQIAEPPTEELTPADLERKRQFDIIENFIKNEPSISRIATKEVPDQEDLTKRNKIVSGGLVTESFAKVLEKQGKFDKARDIYKKLMSRNPEKKAYFADKMTEMENHRKAAEE